MSSPQEDAIGLDEPVHLCAYDATWPEAFRNEAAQIRGKLPGDIPVEHIGSTAVPGLLAKPVIDIMLGLETHHERNAVEAALQSLGYQSMGEAGVSGRLYFRKRAAHAFNVHAVRHGGELWAANVILRDYLRTHPEAADRYTAIKQKAVQSGADMLLTYSDFKSSFVRDMISQALDAAK
jgi:GrpB-like predicted nucleotidyltransferase (UPF0157 family)